MKHFALRLTLAFTLFGAAVNSYAQAQQPNFADVTGGSVIISITSELASILQAQNLAAAAYTEAPYDNQIPFLGILSGVFDLNCGRGSLAAQGDFVVTNGVSTVKVVSLNVETASINRPVITGAVYLNGNYIAHIAILDLTPGNPLGAPLPSGKFVRLQDIPATLSPAMTAIIANAFGVEVPAGTPAATVAINTSFIPV